MTRKRGSNEEMSSRLATFIAEREKLSPDAVEITSLRRLAGGASRLLWSLDVSLDDATGGARKLELVVRQDPPGRISDGGMALEFELLQAARAVKVPVPTVHWCADDAELLGSPFFVMDRLQGEAIPKRLLRDDRYARTRAELLPRLAEVLALIHTVDCDQAGLTGRISRPPPGESAAQVEIDRLSLGYRGFAVEPHPVLDLAERWLREHIPPETADTLVHGDYRVGNFMFDETGLVAVLDWELAHMGDPAEDLAWLCVRAWRFGNDLATAGGLGTRDELIAAYVGAGGCEISAERLRFWEVAGNFKLALVFITQARAYLDGAHATVELASLGRRTAEGEAELLNLIEAAP